MEEFCLTTFAPEKNLRSCTGTIFWPLLCNYISDLFITFFMHSGVGSGFDASSTMHENVINKCPHLLYDVARS